MFCENLVASLPYCHLRVFDSFFVYLCGVGLAAPWCSGLILFDPLGELWHHCLWSRIVRKTELVVRPKSSRGRKLPALTFCQHEIMCYSKVSKLFCIVAHIKWLFVWQTPWSLKAEGARELGGSVFQHIPNSFLAHWLEKLCPREEEYGILIKYFVNYLIQDGPGIHIPGWKSPLGLSQGNVTSRMALCVVSELWDSTRI